MWCVATYYIFILYECRVPEEHQVLREPQDKGNQQESPENGDHLVPKEMQGQLDQLDLQDSVVQKEIRSAYM